MNKATRFYYSQSRDRITWRTAAEVREGFDLDDAPEDWRPLIVIDPEDREQVALLLSHYHSWKWTAEIAEASIDDMQAALRSIVAESEPEEPTGLGAVVRDGKGSDWVRIYQHHDCNDWRRTDDVPGSGESQARARWANLPRPLTVLSDGYNEETQR